MGFRQSASYRLKKALRKLNSNWNSTYNSNRLKTDYSIDEHRGTDGQSIVGLSVEEYGRMGNSFLQSSNALFLARSLRLPFIQLPKTELIKIDSPTEVSGLTFLPHDYDTSSLGLFLKGTFYTGPRMERLGIRMPLRRQVLQKYLVPAAHILIPEPEPRGCLTIHIRSGDAFDARPHPDFSQPPLAFYKKMIEQARKELGINRVRLVFEDRRNPCVGALETYIENSELTLLLQSGSLKEDLDVLLAARHLTFGYGSFGVGICLLSIAAETVYVFGASGHAYNQFDHLNKVDAWDDVSGRYPDIGEWKASQEQLALMLNLPGCAIGKLEQRGFNYSKRPDWWIHPDEEL
ncbi:hypothetical protein [Ruegeria arenilitoris]|uniref:hypothetical protein n=1 Tax=Ruegeria arenilitoris TaxID=1173585 RepID=UPI0014810076|nr:hypothetical protein [Ruegeria arenilitoris]